VIAVYFFYGGPAFSHASVVHEKMRGDPHAVFFNVLS